MKKNEKLKFLKKYFNNYKKIIFSNNEEVHNKLIEISMELKKTHDRGKKIIIFGNGGSSAISSHFSVDLTKNAGVRCINFNEADLITCFSNDFGYEKWLEKSIEYYGDNGDVLIAISTSGSSKNIINGCKKARKKKFSKIITLTGKKINNEVKRLGDINLWVNSMAYNQVETIHQMWLLSVVDLIIGKSEYDPN